MTQKFYPKHSGTTKQQILEMIKEAYEDVDKKCPLVAENLSDRDVQKYVNDIDALRDLFPAEEDMNLQRRVLLSILTRKTINRLKKGGLL